MKKDLVVSIMVLTFSILSCLLGVIALVLVLTGCPGHDGRTQTITINAVDDCYEGMDSTGAEVLLCPIDSGRAK